MLNNASITELKEFIKNDLCGQIPKGLQTALELSEEETAEAYYIAYSNRYTDGTEYEIFDTFFKEDWEFRDDVLYSHNDGIETPDSLIESIKNECFTDYELMLIITSSHFSSSDEYIYMDWDGGFKTFDTDCLYEEADYYLRVYFIDINRSIKYDEFFELVKAFSKIFKLVEEKQTKPLNELFEALE